MMSLGRLFRRRVDKGAAETLYRRIVEQARASEFYRDLGVPDSFDGRFEMLALHVFLVLNRLRLDRADDASQSLAQALLDRLIADFDASLREMGAGDLGVGRRVRRMAEGVNGRLAAYDAGLAEGGAALLEAIRRNVYGTTEPTAAELAAMTGYVQASRDALVPVGAADLAQGMVHFATIPSGAGSAGLAGRR